jgi:hypothetical protein
MPSDTLFHPTFLYESLWNLAGVLILLALDRKFSFRRGRLFCLYAMYYTLGRVWIEAMRIDDAEQISLFGITTRLNVWTSILVFAGALIAFILLGLRKASGPDTPFLPGREPAVAQADAAAVPAGTDADSDSDSDSDPDSHGAVGTDSDSSVGTDRAGTADVDRSADVDRPAGAGRRSAVPVPVPAAVPADAATIRNADSAVSDSESRANLRKNQSGPETAPEAEGTK